MSPSLSHYGNGVDFLLAVFRIAHVVGLWQKKVGVSSLLGYGKVWPVIVHYTMAGEEERRRKILYYLRPAYIQRTGSSYCLCRQQGR